MIDNEDRKHIEKLIDNKKIIDSKLLSSSFGINCFKITTSDKQDLITKFYKKKNNDFNAIVSEAKNLIFLNDLKLNFFPKVHRNNSHYLIMSFIKNNEIKPNKTEEDLLNAIISIHSNTDEKYGLNFDSQIGGIKQKNKRSNNWVDFFRDLRLGYVYELINSSYPMDGSINAKIELLLKNLGNFIPKNPRASLLHGDLWEGNILFNFKSFSGFIDPGSFYGHNEMEIAYLRWFNPKFIDNNFIEKYQERIYIDSDYMKYEFIYQLYYSLLNVYLWDRSYIDNVSELLKKLKL